MSSSGTHPTPSERHLQHVAGSLRPPDPVGSDEVADLVAQATDDRGALAAIEAGVDRLRAARQAQARLAELPAEELRAALNQRGHALGGSA